MTSELAAVREQEQAKCATGEPLQETLMEEQIEKRMGTLEGGMSELAAKLARKHNDLLSVGSADPLSTLNSNFARSIRELNDDVQRLYSQSFGALVEDRRSPDGGWYQEQEFHRFLKMVARPGASVAC